MPAVPGDSSLGLFRQGAPVLLRAAGGQQWAAGRAHRDRPVGHAARRPGSFWVSAAGGHRLRRRPLLQREDGGGLDPARRPEPRARAARDRAHQAVLHPRHPARRGPLRQPRAAARTGAGDHRRHAAPDAGRREAQALGHPRGGRGCSSAPATKSCGARRTTTSTSFPASGSHSPPGARAPAAIWLSERKIGLIGSDNWGVEVLPNLNAPAGFLAPVHHHFLAKSGIPMQESMHLKDLADAEVYEFAYISARCSSRGPPARRAFRSPCISSGPSPPRPSSPIAPPSPGRGGRLFLRGRGRPLPGEGRAMGEGRGEVSWEGDTSRAADKKCQHFAPVRAPIPLPPRPRSQRPKRPA